MANSKGDGSIYQAKDKNGKPIPNCWRISVSFGSSGCDRQRVQCTVHGTKAEAKKKRDEIRRQHEEGLAIDAGKVTVSEFIETWLEARQTTGKVSESTIKNYRARLKTIEPYIGKKKLNKVTAAEIERAYAQLKAKKKLSGTTLNKLHILLKSVFEKACDYDLILRNPCNKVESPSVDKPDRKPLTQEEGATLLHKLDMEEARIIREMDEKEERQVKKGNQFGRSSIRGLANLGFTIGTRIALATGLRRGEVFGLTWKNVNLRQNTITVAQTLTKEGDIKDPKTGAGRRTISIDENTAAHLKMWRKRQREELAKLTIKLGDATPVCCSERGEWVNLANFERWWRSFREEAGFDGLRFHELRHSQATLLLANGTDLKTVQDRMGHANGAITLNWYAHAIPENDQKAAQLVGNLFGTPPKRTQRGQSKIINLAENSTHAERIGEKPDAVGLALA
ncbi:MAG: site-specific integrase [Atopobiaceae bacterium]|nr:site-specific integrase [Atopobiaceae bacterium]